MPLGVLFVQFVITHRGEPVGTVNYEKERLYLKIRCECKPLWDRPIKISVQAGRNTQLLGTCIPEGGVLRLEKKVSLRTLGEGELRFFISNLPEEKKAEVCSHQRFDALEDLMQTHFIKEGDKTYLSFTDRTAQDQQDSDRIP